MKNHRRLFLPSRRDFLIGVGAFASVGYTSSSWSQTGQRVRRNLANLASDDAFFSDYSDAIRAMHELQDDDPRSWKNQSYIHGEHCPHGELDFFSWHRHYLNQFEKICGALIGKTDFALPYWDWTKNNGRLPSAFYENGPLNVEFWNDPSNVSFPMWGRVRTTAGRLTSATRGLGDDPIRGGAFQESRITRISRLRDFETFQARLEGSPHNLGHTLTGVGGSRGFHMGFALSPLDPIFWLHHCNVDRIWAKWQSSRNSTPSIERDYGGQFFDENGDAVSVNANQARDFLSLGFTYDELVPELLTGNDAVIFESLSANPPVGPIDIAASNRLFAEARNDVVSRPEIETRVNVSTGEIGDVLATSRQFNATSVPFIHRTATEPSRVLAELEITDERGPATGLISNVFINCGYLSPETPASDEHFADSFSFFGMSMGGVRKIVVDITDPLRRQAEDGRIDKDIAVQVMPIPVNAEEELDTSFAVRSVKLIQT